MEGKNKVFVTGMGIASSIGMNVKDFSYALKNKISGIKRNPNKEDQTIGGYIEEINIKELLNFYSPRATEEVKKAQRFVARSPLPIKCATLASIEAYINSGLCQGQHKPEATGIIVAGNNINLKLHYETQEKYQEHPEYVSPSYALQYLDTDHVGIISEILNIRGEGFTIGGASASGNVAIIKAAQLIAAGFMDRCLVVGALADLSPVEVQAFKNVGAMASVTSEEEAITACRPFDLDHRGFVYGQASGCIILESENSVKDRNGVILAEILGWGMNLDGNRLADPSAEGEYLAMTKALETANVSPEHIDYINAHGSSSKIGDITELEAIKRVFGERNPNLWINSTKTYTGHCLYSAGIVEAIATIIQIQEGFVHGNINLKTPIDKTFNFVKGDCLKTKVKHAMSNSFGFGGINTSIILKKG